MIAASPCLLMCAPACVQVRDRRPLDSLHCFTRTCRPDPFHPYRFAVLVDGPALAAEGTTDFDSALAYALELPLAAPLHD